jgi:hypothetical protein
MPASDIFNYVSKKLKAKDLAAVEAVVKKFPNAINLRDPDDQKTPLIAACCVKGNAEGIIRLLDLGADANLTANIDGAEQNAFAMACRTGQGVLSSMTAGLIGSASKIGW